MEKKIINSWSFIAFVKTHGTKVSVGTCTTKSGETFPAVCYNNGEKKTYAHFGPSLKEGLTYAELCAQAKDLQVVQLAVDAKTLKHRQENNFQLESYIICVVGEGSWEQGSGDFLADAGVVEFNAA